MTFKRKVFYLSGFDPRGARHYHALYAAQAARYAELAGEDVRVSKRARGAGPSVDWDVENPTADTQIAYSFLVWDDMIRASWISHPIKLFAASVHMYRNTIARMDWPATLAMQHGPAITLMSPLFTTMLLPLVVLLIASAIGAVWLPWWGALLSGLSVAGLASLPMLTRLKSLWLLRLFIFNDAISEHGVPPQLAERLDAFANTIADALARDDDELLFITHSNGSILGVMVMERLLARFGGAMPDRFAFVTLGHCIGLSSLRSDANHFRESLSAVNCGHFRWLDIGATPDGAAYTQTDPFRQVGGVKTPALEMLSARIFKFNDPVSYAAKRKNKYEFHFEYLRVGDRLSPIDHPSMTVGRRSLADAVAAFRAIK